MTEQEWLTCTDPIPMLGYIEARMSDRKKLLFGVACCRRIRPLLKSKRSRQAVEIYERHAAKRAATRELDKAMTWAWGVAEEASMGILRLSAKELAAARAVDRLFPDDYAGPFLSEGTESAAVACGPRKRRREKLAQCELLRDLVGNPFRPLAFDPDWLQPSETSLARIIYEGRGFTWMPKLSAALGLAGCRDEIISSHCREPGGHARGCWVLDSILGRS